MFDFLNNAVSEPGVTMFNYAVDTVNTLPIMSEYTVEYCFLSVEDIGMRVECMYIDQGTSPLHDSLTSFHNPSLSSTPGFDEPVTVHFSFKTRADEYRDVTSAMRSAGAKQAQSCESTYGLFSYWRIEAGGDNLFLKPRVNKRDPEPTPPPNTAKAGERGEFGYPGVGRRIADAMTPPAS
jgi:hypothetical protein